MSDRANKFLENWVTENVRTVFPEDQPATAESLATLCIADALKVGITEDDLGDASSEISDGGLISYMSGAIDAAALADLEAITRQDD